MIRLLLRFLRSYLTVFHDRKDQGSAPLAYRWG